MPTIVEILNDEGFIPDGVPETMDILDEFIPGEIPGNIIPDDIDVKDTLTHIFNPAENPEPSKRQKTDTMVYRKKSPISASSIRAMKTKLRKVSCNAVPELHSAVSAVVTELIATDLTKVIAPLNIILKNDESSGRTGDKIRLKSIEFIMPTPIKDDGKPLELEVFLIKPTNVGALPLATDFTPVDKSPSLYNPIRGQQLIRLVPTLDKNEMRFKKNFNCMEVKYILNVALQNSINIVIRNYSGFPFNLSGVIKMEYYP